MQEDSHVAHIGLAGDPNAAFFAVFDGHAGSEVSRFAARYVVSGAVSPTLGLDAWQ